MKPDMPQHDAAFTIEAIRCELGVVRDIPLARQKWEQDKAEILERELTQNAPFDHFQNAWFYGPDGSGSASLNRIAFWVIDRLAAGASTTEILIDAAELAASNTAHLIAVSPVLGVQIDEAVHLIEGVRLVPASSVSESWHVSKIDQALSPSPFHRPSSTLLLQDLSVKPAFLKRPSLEGTPPRESVTSPAHDERSFTRAMVRAALLLLTTGPIELPATRYVQPQMNFFGAGGARGTITPPYVPSDQTVQTEDVIRTFAAMQRFNDPTGLLRAIDRLGKARLSNSLVDKAVDLGMAFELALMHGSSDSNSEIRFKTALRAAWLLGSDTASRAKTFVRAQQLYDARSKAVHSGLLSTKKPFDSIESDRLVQELLSAISSRGSFPDWQSLVLGADS
jgi:hypothetical protein